MLNSGVPMPSTCFSAFLRKEPTMAQSASSVRDEYSSRSSSTAEDLSQSGSEMGRAAGQGIDRAMQGARDAAHSVAEAGSEAGHQVQQVADNFGRAIERSVKEQPTATLLMAAALGFVIGALWKS